MADAEDKEKAEKLAAAKKRFEQLKKQQKGKAAGKGKKKDDKAAAADEKAEDAASEAPAAEASETASVAEDEKPEDATALDEKAESGQAPQPRRQPSMSIQSKQRSESFRNDRGGAPALSPGLKSPGTSPFSPENEVQDIYRKQASRIEELEKENKSLQDAKERLAKAEAELDELHEGSSDTAELRSKASLVDERANEVERLNAELASAQRQLAQAQQSAKASSRRVSGPGPASDLESQLASKTSTMESLELEMSNLRNQLSTVQTSVSTHEATAKDAQDRASTAETTADNAKQELETLRASINAPKEKSDTEDPETLGKRITLLESELRTANTAADESQKRASALEQKIEALTKLHKDSLARDAELKDLRQQVKTLSSNQSRASHVRDASNEFELGEDEGVLQSRIRELEAENFNLRRGIWRERRAEMQPGMSDATQSGSPGYEDVDLNGASPTLRSALPARGSSFQDVITSGISAFTGRDNRRGTIHERKQSLGLLSEDGFDEEAFAMAQEEEARRRVERVKEVKRGLEQWRGFRVDLVELRRGGLGGGRECGPIFGV